MDRLHGPNGKLAFNFFSMDTTTKCPTRALNHQPFDYQPALYQHEQRRGGLRSLPSRNSIFAEVFNSLVTNIIVQTLHPHTLLRYYSDRITAFNVTNDVSICCCSRISSYIKHWLPVISFSKFFANNCRQLFWKTICSTLRNFSIMLWETRNIVLKMFEVIIKNKKF